MKIYVDCSNTSHIEYIFIDYNHHDYDCRFHYYLQESSSCIIFDSFPYGAIVQFNPHQAAPK